MVDGVLGSERSSSAFSGSDCFSEVDDGSPVNPFPWTIWREVVHGRDGDDDLTVALLKVQKVQKIQKRQKTGEKARARRRRPGVTPAMGSGEDEEEDAAVQFPWSVELEGVQGSGAMAGNLWPRLPLLMFRENAGEREEKRSGGGAREEWRG